jgi:hypothetical protein
MGSIGNERDSHAKKREMGEAGVQRPRGHLKKARTAHTRTETRIVGDGC